MEVVLLLEHEPGSLTAVKNHFAKIGNVVIVERDFKSAKKRLAILETTNSTIKVLVMDEDLPKDPARKFFAYVKARFPKVEPISMAKNTQGVVAFKKVSFKAPLKLVEKPDLDYTKGAMMEHAKKLNQMHRETVIPKRVYPSSFIKELAIRFLTFFKSGETPEAMDKIKEHASKAQYPVTSEKVEKLRLVWDSRRNKA